jgi:hypothetical protein
MLKNITFSADDALIEAARERARLEKTTLNEKFRRWLAEYARQEAEGERLLAQHLDAMKRLKGKVVIGRKLTRDEFNAR